MIPCAGPELWFQTLSLLVGSAGKHCRLLKEEKHARKPMQNANKLLGMSSVQSGDGAGPWELGTDASTGLSEQDEGLQPPVCGGPSCSFAAGPLPAAACQCGKPPAHAGAILLWLCCWVALFFGGGQRNPKCGLAWWNLKERSPQQREEKLPFTRSGDSEVAPGSRAGAGKSRSPLAMGFL